MRVALASDHAGYTEKERLKAVLEELGVEFDDLGTVSEESVDYPDYARKVAEQVAHGRVEQGVLVCGSGTGMAITANKVPGVRAAVAWSEETARLARQHNNANVLALGARTTPPVLDRLLERRRAVDDRVRRACARRPHYATRRHSEDRARVVHD